MTPDSVKPRRHFWWDVGSDWGGVFRTVAGWFGYDKPPYYNWVDFTLIAFSIEHSLYIHDGRFEVSVSLLGLHLTMTTGYNLDELP